MGNSEDFRASIKTGEVPVAKLAQNMQELDSYRSYLYDEELNHNLGGEFMQTIEAYNQILNELERYKIIGEIGFKARIKDPLRSLENTDIKALDDIFGAEIVVPTEEGKEFIILMNRLMARAEKERIHDKENGYKAYHFIGYMDQSSIQRNDLSNIDIEQFILYENKRRQEEVDSAIRKYNDAIRKLLEDPDIYEIDRESQIKELEAKIKQLSKTKKIFPILEREIRSSKDGKLNSINRIGLLSILNFARGVLPENGPVIEFQIKTAKVSEEATFGTAKHDTYKSKDREKVLAQYKADRLYRGVNFPFKFVRKSGKIVLQDYMQTILEVWPCLKPYIFEDSLKGTTKKCDRFDYAMSKIFPFLEPYIGDCEQEICFWDTLKNYVLGIEQVKSDKGEK